jgi:3-oxoacyl-[acyl-carrier protein] reductase
MRPVSIITGGGKGIGSAIARKLANTGHNIVINFSHSQNEALKTLEECKALGIDAIAIKADISKKLECQKVIEETMEKFGKITNLINNAGITVFADYTDLKSQSEETFEQILAVNLMGPFYMVEFSEPYLRESRGSVVNISSQAGITGIGSSIPYAVSKGALNTLTLSLAKSLSPEVRVNAICPSVVTSTWWNQRFKSDDKLFAFQKKMAEDSLLQINVSPEDIAELTSFLTNENKSMTGELLRVNAGSHLGQAPAKKRM